MEKIRLDIEPLLDNIFAGLSIEELQNDREKWFQGNSDASEIIRDKIDRFIREKQQEKEKSPLHSLAGVR